jgi:hypothetical protein
LHTEGFSDVREFNGGTIEFEAFKNFSSECGEVGSDSFVTIGIENEDTGVGVKGIVKLNEMFIIGGGGPEIGGIHGTAK